jgi:hypothetical protein
MRRPNRLHTTYRFVRDFRREGRSFTDKELADAVYLPRRVDHRQLTRVRKILQEYLEAGMLTLRLVGTRGHAVRTYDPAAPGEDQREEAERLRELEGMHPADDDSLIVARVHQRWNP